MFRFHTGRIAATLLLLSTTTIPQTALAASYLDGSKKEIRRTLSASLVEMTQTDGLRTTQTLDWRQSSVELTFELPPAQRTSEIILTLSADPLTRVARNVPLQVQFNGGEAVPIRSNGNGFEARIPLDAGRARGSKNVLRISYPTPAGADCITPAHGAWSIDLANSSLRISGRANNRHWRLSEVTELLEHPALTPDKIGLIAKGADATDMQALAAQGLSLRTPSVPEFSLSKRGTDFNVIMVKRSGLYNITNDPVILNSTGPRIFVPRGKPMELIFTADTDAEILELLENFATRQLPNSRRPISSIGEIYMQRRLDSDRQSIEGKTQLSDLAFRPAGTQPGEQNYAFNVKDPTSTQGKLLLRVSTTQDIGEKSRLRVSLNGKSLGATKLDKKRKSVVFDINPSDLNTDSNILTLSPDLSAQTTFACPSISAFTPGYSIGPGSHLTFSQTENSTVTDLAHFASTGGLFAKTESYIALPRRTQDFQSALRVLGQMAKASGHGFTFADYSRTSNVPEDKHILIIGPSDMVKGHLTGAPQAFREALSGQSSTGSNLLQAEYGRSASLNEDDTVSNYDAVLKYAAAKSGSYKINRGGVAALYGSGDGRLTGVISSTPGASFSRASENLIKPGHWKALQGGVARWTSSSIVMAQTAQSDDNIRKPVSDSRVKLSDLGLSIFEDYDFYLPNFALPEFSWPEFEIPKVGFPDLNWPSFKSAPLAPAENDINVLNENSAELRYIEPNEKAEKIAAIIPRLKPIVKIAAPQPKAPSPGLRGPFQYVDKKKTQFGIIHDLKHAMGAKWVVTKQWFETRKDTLIESRSLNEAASATDSLQDSVEPAGRTLKSAILDKLPAKGLVQLGDRTVSLYGLILIITFSLVLLFMSLVSSVSRLGGRHQKE